VGVHLSGSAGARLYHNTISKTSGYCAILVSNHPSGLAVLSDNHIANNIIADNTTTYDFSAPNPTGLQGPLYTSDYNCYYRTNSLPPFLLDGVKITGLSSLTTSSNLENHSLSQNPNFNLKDPDDFSLHPTSALIDAGIDITGISSDIRGITRPSGTHSDIGAFEFDPVDSVPPSIPTGLDTEELDWNSFSVRWNSATDNIAISGYDVYLNGEYFTTTPELSLSLENLEANRNYSVFVMAVDSSGLKSSASETVFFSTGNQPDTEAPTCPTNLRANRKCGSGIQLTWRPSSDNVGVVLYRIYRNGVFLASTSATWLNDSSVEPARKYTYQISAIDAAGNQSDLSKSILVVIPRKDDKENKDDKDD
jgi:chitodextrinase